MRHTSIIVACALAGCSPKLAVSPEPTGHTRFAGMPLQFGGPDAPSDLDWTFGDGGAARGQTVTHSYARPGRYVVKAQSGGASVNATIEVVSRRVAAHCGGFATVGFRMKRTDS